MPQNGQTDVSEKLLSLSAECASTRAAVDHQDQRLTRIENLVSGDGSSGILKELQKLSSEISSFRGLYEQRETLLKEASARAEESRAQLHKEFAKSVSLRFTLVFFVLATLWTPLAAIIVYKVFSP